MKEIEVEFTKIVGEGKTLGRKDGKIVFSYGVLPQEKAKIKVLKEKKNFIEGEVIEILHSSPQRVVPRENHYLSCSPWQIMNYDLQIKTKKNLIEDLLYQTTRENIKLDNFYSAEKIWGYRTKIEYSFMESDGDLSLAFHKRGDYSQKVLLPSGCALINEKANGIALNILEKLKKKGIKKEKLKTLVIRKAENTSDIIACLYVQDMDVNISCLDIKDLKGFVLIYSNPIISVSTIDKVIKVEGCDFIDEKVIGIPIRYSFDCFFQNNVVLLEKAIFEIKTVCSGCRNIADIYCGVGVIGFGLKNECENLIGIESSESAVRYAKLNAEKSCLKNYKIISSLCERLQPDFLNNIDAVIIDPPRAGLHKNVVKSIMSNLPQKIVYLSCNPITQGRDASYFLEKYKISKAIGFDFYPNTPHVENLLVFEKK